MRDLVFHGVEFGRTEPTFLRPYERPPSGDWAIHRGGAVLVEGAVNVSFSSTRFADAGEAHAGLKEVLAGRPSSMPAPRVPPPRQESARARIETPKPTEPTSTRVGHETLPPTRRRGAESPAAVGLVVAIVAVLVAAVAIGAWAWL